MRKLYVVRFTVAVVISTAAVAGCGDDKPTADAWRAKVVPICAKLIEDRIGATTDFSDPPTLEEVMAFYADFAPKFAAAAKEIKALDRPSGIDAELKRFIAAVDAGVVDTTNSVTDQAAVEAEMAAGDQTKPVFAELEAASIAVGLEECNG